MFFPLLHLHCGLIFRHLFSEQRDHFPGSIQIILIPL
jgi:hypothetical protein